MTVRNKFSDRIRTIIMNAPLLNLEERSSLIERMHNGDEEARETLILSYAPLAAKLSAYRKILPFPLEYDDLWQEAIIAISGAVDRLQANRSGGAYWYVYKAIIWHLNEVIRCAEQSNKEYMYEDPSFDLYFEQEIHTMEDQEEIRYLFSFLTEKEQQVLIHRYGLFGEKEKNNREVSLLFKNHENWISTVHTRALKKLKEHVFYF